MTTYDYLMNKFLDAEDTDEAEIWLDAIAMIDRGEEVSIDEVEYHVRQVRLQKGCLSFNGAATFHPLTLDSYSWSTSVSNALKCSFDCSKEMFLQSTDYFLDNIIQKFPVELQPYVQIRAVEEPLTQTIHLVAEARR